MCGDVSLLFAPGWDEKRLTMLCVLIMEAGCGFDSNDFGEISLCFIYW